MRLAKSFAVSAAVALILGVGFSSIASADMDVIVKPGETKSVYVSKPQRVNVACMHETPPEPATPVEFNMPEGKTNTFCSDAAQLLNYLAPEDPSQGVSGVSASCDANTQRVSAKFMGIRVGVETRLVAHFKSANCTVLSWAMHDLQSLKSPDSIVRISYQCDTNNPDIWIKASVSRFQ
ncbi:MAG: hypothetical protein ACJ763_05060 [Bdellovibrionia bacterium]